MSQAVVLLSLLLAAAQQATSQQLHAHEAKLLVLEVKVEEGTKILLGADFKVLQNDFKVLQNTLDTKLVMFSAELKDMKKFLKEDPACKCGTKAARCRHGMCGHLRVGLTLSRAQPYNLIGVAQRLAQLATGTRHPCLPLAALGGAKALRGTLANGECHMAWVATAFATG
eukprot:XP_001692319.1 predicted protein [Chlamydomonas reinhardtii]